MKVFVINLDRNTDRLKAVSERLQARGVAFERFPAVDGRALDAAVRRRVHSRVRTLFARGFGMTPGEIGCTLSHLKVYQRIVDENLDAACVMEDDASPEPGFAEGLGRIEAQLDASRPQVILLAPILYPEPEVPEGLHRLEDAMFADAYVITRPAAAAILRANSPVRCMSDFWGYLKRRAGFELYQLGPVLSRQDFAAFGTDVRGAKPTCGGTWYWKLWRAFGKAADWLLWKAGC